MYFALFASSVALIGLVSAGGGPGGAFAPTGNPAVQPCAGPLVGVDNGRVTIGGSCGAVGSGNREGQSLDGNKCIRNKNGQLVWQLSGNFDGSCNTCNSVNLPGAPYSMKCSCRNDAGVWADATIDLNANFFQNTDHNGYNMCCLNDKTCSPVQD